ncbi:MAG: bifunctional riboflavin kinase/FAD synthetase [Bacteroidetes bacterium]|nr:MAG: bifunctional riboflavin kinase/FAD synthetase [Bacteroidota bacterium]
MKVFRDLDQLAEISNPVVTIGTFDGVHKGHQMIIDRLNEEAKKIGGESVLFTFYPHPRMILFPDSHGIKLIQTQVQKIDKLRRFGLQNVIIHPFTKEFSRLTATEFVRDFLVNTLHVKKLVIGYDHQFGKNREGGIQFLKDVSELYGFEVIEIPAQEIDEVNISSTKIRNAIKEGNVDLANTFLGEPYEIDGIVIYGDKVGTTIGYPTANIEVDSEVKLIPGNGVYAVEVIIGEQIYHGIMNIGNRPTIAAQGDQRLEVHILDFSGDIYGQNLTVRLLKRIRNEQVFENLDLLKEQIHLDEEFARNFFTAV